RGERGRGRVNASNPTPGTNTPPLTTSYTGSAWRFFPLLGHGFPTMPLPRPHVSLVLGDLRSGRVSGDPPTTLSPLATSYWSAGRGMGAGAAFPGGVRL